MVVCMNKQKFPFLGQKYKNLYLGIRSQDSPAENEKINIQLTWLQPKHLAFYLSESLFSQRTITYGKEKRKSF